MKKQRNCQRILRTAELSIIYEDQSSNILLLAACLSFLFDKNLIWHEQIFSSLPPIEHFWQEPKILIFSQNDPGVSEAVQTWQFNFGLLPSKIV